jgi:ferredoxin-nitrite reductase
LRVRLGGITGHGDFARDAGVVVRPAECIEVAAAILRVFLERGDRTNRQKARMKYVLDAAGHERYLEWVEERLGRKLARVGPEACAPRPPVDRSGHIGFHRQKQAGLHYAGIALPVGRMSVAQMRGVAAMAGRWGGSIRLTVWQNVLVTHIPDAAVAEAKAAIEALGLDWRASAVRAGLVACTGNTGCKFSAADTKGHALAIAEHLEPRIRIESPVNIHLTGCHHSCAQHYIGDIGLVATRIDAGGDDTVEGYHVHVGGGAGEDAGLAREIHRDVRAEDAPEVIRRMLAAYLAGRTSESETFLAFTRRLDDASLRAAFAPPRAVAA